MIAASSVETEAFAKMPRLSASKAFWATVACGPLINSKKVNKKKKNNPKVSICANLLLKCSYRKLRLNGKGVQKWGELHLNQAAPGIPHLIPFSECLNVTNLSTEMSHLSPNLVKNKQNKQNKVRLRPLLNVFSLKKSTGTKEREWVFVRFRLDATGYAWIGTVS